MSIDETRLNAFLGKAVGDLGAAMSATLMLVGDRLGLYKALAREPLTSTELAQKTGTHERYVREWLGNQGAGGYVEYEAKAGKWFLSPEQALCLADPAGPVDSRVRTTSSRPPFTRSSGPWRIFVPARAWSGANTMPVCSTAPSVSSAPVTTRT